MTSAFKLGAVEVGLSGLCALRSIAIGCAVVLGSAGICACADGTQPADSPADVETSPNGAPSDEGNPAETTDSSSAADTASTSSASLTPADLSAALQLVLDDDEIQPYLKLGEPGRFPLKVAGEIPDGVALTKGEKPVEFVFQDAANKAAITFTSIETGSDRVSVRYRFDVEGVRGAATVEKRDGHWELINSRVTER